MGDRGTQSVGALWAGLFSSFLFGEGLSSKAVSSGKAELSPRP